MRQEIELTERTEPTRSAFTRETFDILFALAKRSTSAAELRDSLPMSQPDCESLVSELLSAALLDIVPGPLTSREAQRFCLTDRGGAVLLRILEQTCEIPEASATVP